LYGAKVIDYEIGSAALLQGVRASRVKVHPQFGFKIRTSIVLLDEGDEVSFRNLRIRPLTSAPGPAGK
jgi:hypothetical protein